MKTCVIIPTYNESLAISNVIREVQKHGLDIVVIDDGSTDNTVEVAIKTGAVVLRNEINQGKGASLVRGFDYALSKGYDAVITMDGDGQHSPREIAGFLKAAAGSGAGIYIGNRMGMTKGMPWLRILTNQFMSWLISLAAKQKIPDTQCGYRLIKKPVLEKVRLETSKYETESEILIKTSRLGFKIESVGIETIYSGEKSQINPFIDTLRFIKFIAKEL
ncbi:MAG: glycosyltransferase family 2 protein [Candidatus Omnitrophica bacterium]|nr:glycosyltransferase family 2 protein [Candidatus Omnitrophota bacterium]MBU1870276.1 glycosyltransferase family 2 protein [Candidatus Omnitrophota bacterium]